MGRLNSIQLKRKIEKKKEWVTAKKKERNWYIKWLRMKFKDIHTNMTGNDN